MESNKYTEEELPEIFDNGFDYADDFNEGLALVKKKDDFFFINDKGEDIFPTLRFEYADRFSDGYAAVIIEGYKCFIDKSGNIKSGKRIIDELINFSEGATFIRYENETKWVCVDHDFNELFSIESYVPCCSFIEGYAVIKRRKKFRRLKPGILDDNPIYKNEQILLKGWGYYDDENEDDSNIGSSSEVAYFDVSDEDKKEYERILNNEDNYKYYEEEEPTFEYNYIDKTGKILSEEWYCFACPFSEGFAIVGFDNQYPSQEDLSYNFIDKHGKLLSDSNFAVAENFSEGMAAVGIEHYHEEETDFFFITKSGEKVFPLNKFGYKYDGIALRRDLQHLVQKNECKYYCDARSYENGSALIGLHEGDRRHHMLVNHEGDIIYDLKLGEEYLFGFIDGFAGFETYSCIDDKTMRYYRNIHGEECFDLYEEIYRFSDGLARVKLNGKYNFTDKEGNYLIK